MHFACGFGTLYAAGCATQDMNRQRVMRFHHKDTVKALSQGTPIEEIPEPKEAIINDPNMILDHSHSLLYKEALQTAARFDGQLPAQNLTLYYPVVANPDDPNATLEFVVRKLDTTHEWNQCADELKDMLESIPADPQRVGFNIGTPDRQHHVTSRAGANQSWGGLLGVKTFYTGENGKFLVNAHQISGIDSKLRNDDTFRYEILFGPEAFGAKKVREDWLYLINTAENAGLGFAAANVGGAVGATAESVINGIWAYFEGIEPSERTILTDGTEYVTALDQQASDIYNILKDAERLGATEIILFPYAMEGQVKPDLGIVLANGADNVRYCSTGNLSFDVKSAGPNHLMDALYRALGFGSRILYNGRAKECLDCCGNDGTSKTINVICS